MTNEEIQFKAKQCCKSLSRFFYIYCKTAEQVDDKVRYSRAVQRARRVRAGANYLTAPEIEKLEQIYSIFLMQNIIKK